MEWEAEVRRIERVYDSFEQVWRSHESIDVEHFATREEALNWVRAQLDELARAADVLRVKELDDGYVAEAAYTRLLPGYHEEVEVRLRARIYEEPQAP